MNSRIVSLCHSLSIFPSPGSWLRTLTLFQITAMAEADAFVCSLFKTCNTTFWIDYILQAGRLFESDGPSAPASSCSTRFARLILSALATDGSRKRAPHDTRAHCQKLSFKPNCMMRAGSVPLIWPAGAVPVVAFGLLKFARLKELNISQRKLSFARSPT